MPFYEKQPYIQPVYSLLAELLDGTIRVPDFQRPSVWQAEQRAELLDSLYRGFPVGTGLLWSGAPSDLPCLKQVGGIDVKQAPGSARLVLDGHQRLATLLRILGPGVLPSPPAGPQDERWYFDLDPAGAGTERFVVHTKASQEPAPHHLPLDRLFNRARLNQWIRERTLTDTQILEADALRDRLRDYNVPVAVLAVKDLDEATESFKRINSSGTPMGTVHMVSALSYADIKLRPEMARRKAEQLGALGWNSQELSDDDLLRVMAGLAGLHPSKYKIAEFVKKLRREPALIGQAFDAVASAAQALMDVGVAGPRLLPYSWQLIVLALAWRELSQVGQQARECAIRTWFHRTTYGGVFAGVNSAISDRARDALVDLAQGGDGRGMERDQYPTVSEVQRFDYRAARSRACALAAAHYQDEGPRGKAHDLLASEGTEALRLATSPGRLTTWWHRVVLPRDELQEARRALTSGIAPSDRWLSHSLGLDANAGAAALEHRRQQILEIERGWVQDADMDWDDAAAPSNLPDDDTDD